MKKMQNLRDEMLIELIIESRCRKTYNELYRLYFDPIHGFINSKLHDFHKSEELANEVLHKIINKIVNREVTITTSFQGLVFTSANNKCIDEIRKRKRMRDKWGVNASYYASGDSVLDSIYDDALNAECSLIREERHQYLHDCINKYITNKRHRVFLKVYNFKGYSYKKIAAIFQVKVGTVKSSINAAKEVLRSRMRLNMAA